MFTLNVTFYRTQTEFVWFTDHRRLTSEHLPKRETHDVLVKARYLFKAASFTFPCNLLIWMNFFRQIPKSAMTY